MIIAASPHWPATSRYPARPSAPRIDLRAVAAAAVIGFVGNETVARYRIRVGRQIGSAALVADGLHARADGFTTLAVLLGWAVSRWAGTGPTR